MKTALALQWAQFSRSLTARIASALLILLPPLLSVGLVVLARSGMVAGPSMAKFEEYATGPFDVAVAAIAGLIVSVISLIAVGFAVAWMFGREWVDRSLGSLFSLPVRRATIGYAKLMIIAAWAAAGVTLALLITLVAAAIAVPQGFATTTATSLFRAWVAGLLMAALALPFAWMAVRFRGYLGATGAIIGATVISQVLASVGVGEWVPYAAPALWAGAGGGEVAAGIGPVHLVWVMVFAVAGAWLSVRSFARARLE